MLFCLSRESAGRAMSGVNPEALDAIDLCRQYRTGEIFLIPVRWNDCQLPLIEIAATRTTFESGYGRTTILASCCGRIEPTMHVAAAPAA